jgi:putative FmdB family regulatory protein
MPIYEWECRKCGKLEVFRPFHEWRLPPKHPHPVVRVLSAPMVIVDIEPYVAMAGDKAGQVIGSRQEHRAFLKRNKLVEFGNDPPKPKPMRPTVRRQEMLRSMKDSGVSEIIRRGSR